MDGVINYFKGFREFIPTWVIVLFAMFWILIWPFFIAIILLFIQMKQRVKLSLDRDNFKNSLEEEKVKFQNFKEGIPQDDEIYLKIKKHLEDLKKEKDNLDKCIEKEKKHLEECLEENNATLNDYNAQIEEKRKEIIELDERILLQDYALYQPTYDFATSTEYKDRLDRVRSEQKAMIKSKTAATCSTEWTVDNNKQKGTKMINDNIKQTIMTFNIACDDAINKVKFNNFDSMEKKIEKSYEKLNSLNESLHIKISWKYMDLKKQELRLAYEYSCKKQEEKEQLKEQRAALKEQLKLQREIEEARARIEKEQNHYSRQRKLLEDQLEVETNEGRKELLREKIKAVGEELTELGKALEHVDYREANERAGYVYIISNIGAFGENVYKIGMTRRLEPLDRIDELSGASVPFKFDLHAMIFSNDAPKLETALHNAFAQYRVNKVNGRKEFFKVPLEEIEKEVKKNHDKSVEFIYLPSAEQYRESIRM